MASSLMSIPDHLKGEIFVRLPEPEDLARTAATCVTFRRVVADGSFLRGFRRLHAAPLLGILDRDGTSATAASSSPPTLNPKCSRSSWCDPLHQRHILLPQVPHDLAASPEFTVPLAHRCHLFIASPGAGENEAAAAMEEAGRGFIGGMIAHCETGVAAFVFSSSTRQWQAAASKGWSDLFPCQGESAMMSSMHPKFAGRHYAYGCFYLESTMNKKLLAFDTRRMEFSIVDVPCETSNMFGLAIVEAGEDTIGMFDIHNDLRYYIRGNKGEGSSQWKIKKTISLPSDYQYYVQASTGRYLLLRKIGPLQSISSSPKMLEVEYVSMDVKTLQLERRLLEKFGKEKIFHIAYASTVI
uniref:F-box domain-containing protein n=1 Tax=Aegilops tauschii TaxID=37682 RepID=R7WEC9_AEGTA